MKSRGEEEQIDMTASFTGLGRAGRGGDRGQGGKERLMFYRLENHLRYTEIGLAEHLDKNTTKIGNEEPEKGKEANNACDLRLVCLGGCTAESEKSSEKWRETERQSVGQGEEKKTTSPLPVRCTVRD